MRPRISEKDDYAFETQGIGTLECVYCYVTEEKNGIYELEAKLHKDSRHFEKVIEGNIIVATHSNKGDLQPFQIYRVQRSIDGFATVYAEHISYRLNKNVVMPYTANGVQAALTAIKENAADTCAFTFATDKTSSAAFELKEPRSIKSLLYGQEGSIVDVYGSGEYEYDNYTVKLWEHRGEDNGVAIRYGKNLTEIVKETDISDIYTAIVPYWKGINNQGQEVTITVPEKVVRSAYVDSFPTTRTIPVDFSNDFENPPASSALRAKAESYINANVRRQLMTSIKTSFIDLSITDEYKNKAEMMSVNLCDYVTVVYEALGVEDKQEVVKVVYDVLLDRNKLVELGELKKTLASVMRPREAGMRTLINTKTTETKRILEREINNSHETLQTQIQISRAACQSEINRVKEELQQEIDKLKNINPAETVYPVGSIYLTVGQENPGTIFGGTWKMLETGRYLRSAPVGGAEQSGGSRTHAHDFTVMYKTFLEFRANIGNNTYWRIPTEAAIPGHRKGEDLIETEPIPFIKFEFADNTPGITQTAIEGGAYDTTVTGETENATIDPPYYTVYMWQRIA